MSESASCFRYFVALAAGLAMLFCVAASGPAFALTSGQASFTLITGNNTTGIQDLVVDSNKCPIEGPTGLHLAGLVTNTSGTTLNGVSATLGALDALSISGGQSATVQIGKMAPGASVLVSWFVAYPCIDGITDAITVLLADAASGFNRALTARVRAAQSAAAGGNVTGHTIGPGAVVGQTITVDVSYDFGNIDNGNEFFLQATGNVGFNSACFRLSGARVQASNISAIPVGTLDRMYFVSGVKQPGNGYVTTIRYFFEYTCANVSTLIRPFSAQTSGATNIKYTGNFDTDPSIQIGLPGATNPFTITKTASAPAFIAGSGASVTYTITVTNPSSLASRISAIVDALPSGMAFLAIAAGSDITAANASSLPQAGATGTLTFEGILAQSFAIAGNSSVRLIYTASVPAAVGDHTNAASATFGQAVSGPATATITVVPAHGLTVTKTVTPYPEGAAGIVLPGNDVVFTITVTNAGAEVDAGTIAITDAMPGDVTFYNGDVDDAGPETAAIVFMPETSGLSCGAGCLTFATLAPCSTAVFDHAPPPGYDPATRCIRISPSGAMAGGLTSPTQFSARFRGRVN